MSKNISKIVSGIFYIVVFAILLWLMLSYIEVVTHNLDGFYNYSSWNCFVIFVKGFSPIH